MGKPSDEAIYQGQAGREENEMPKECPQKKKRKKQNMEL
jgi:hypothetical protein